MTFIYEFYESLLWKVESDGENENKVPFLTLSEIDRMDIFFYFDILIYRNTKELKELTIKYDNNGL